MRYPKEVTEATAMKKATERLEAYEAQLDIINKILPVIATFEGKPISKRLATACQKVMPAGHDATFVRAYGMYHIDISRGGFKHGGNYEKIMSCLIGYEGSTRWDNANMVNIERIKEHNQCYLLNAERIPKLKEGITQIPRIIAIREQVIAGLTDMFKLAEQFEMSYDFDLTD
jgi:hypothetical protein